MGEESAVPHDGTHSLQLKPIRCLDASVRELWDWFRSHDVQDIVRVHLAVEHWEVKGGGIPHVARHHGQVCAELNQADRHARDVAPGPPG